MGVRGVVTLASPAAEPEGVEEQEEEVQAQAEQRHGTEEQDRLQGRDNGQREKFKDLLWGFFVLLLAPINLKGVLDDSWVWRSFDWVVATWAIKKS